MTKIYILDNGSVGSKLLQEEYKGTFDIDVVKVNNSDSLVEQFTKVKNDGTKIFLPFVVEDLVAYNEKLRKEIQEVEALGFKNLLVLPYEGNERKLIEFRAKNAGIPDPTEREYDAAKLRQSGEMFEDKDTVKANRTNRKMY